MSRQVFIDPGRYLETLGIEVELLVDASRAASASTPVPACPGFTVGEVLRHVGGSYRVAWHWITEGRAPRSWQQDPVPGQSTEDYLRTGLADLLAELTTHEAGEYAASWWPADRSYGFWCRRAAHETTVHRFDVQEAVDARISEIAEDFAIDGVDEVLSAWFGQRLALLGVSGTANWSVAVRTGGHHWIARAGPGYTEAWPCSAEEAARADGLVSGSPALVYLWLWGRRSHPWVSWERDDNAIAQFWALMRLATR
ncbi:maleylpyruvate isomerase N-terminal domain-containing protein [Amycolatopsis sp.]|uniref:maleylpyruvate isomerase N-terminal domain-containing protein n=1 Tax=Amycolatopsis sp. TaxID=37632 RepID=UPI002B982667|nr:maleylpyruvate isomerase N-terminal domain-containing protein [Amycolatopsis sp.]HVV08680.1 maleylpyruvate isomerase N-terminal domain-containing protein [Amycolatopsis sp.]